MKQKQVEKILVKRIDISGIAKDLLALGFIVPVERKAIAPGTDLLALMRSPNRLKKLPDGWFRDSFLSMFYGKNFDWAPEKLEKHIPWQPAQEHAAQYGRQPSVFEWETLRDRSKYNPAIIGAAKVLNLKTNDYYWTNEPHAGNPGDAWFVDLKDGSVFYCSKDFSNYVRPVRLSQ